MASGAVLSYGRVVDGVVVVVEWVWALIGGDGDVGVDGDEQTMVIPISNIFFVSILGLVLWRR